ncbi:transposase [Streptomyces sp. HD]|uniref:transposase n=1 Tax=Streptomyces sp. HD TaxID=3020892 RepID=UPI00232F3390|nr:transposase [Streptomyces sp. HD]MDC0771500.1 transposase [Streptomyces sp. HD]
MMPVAGADLSKGPVPDELWELAAPLLSSFAARPQDAGTAPCDGRAVFTAVVYALTSGCSWRHLPPTFGTSPATAHPRFMRSLAAGSGSRESEGYRRSAGEPRDVGRLAADERRGHVDPLGLTQPSLLFRTFPTEHQISFDLGKPGRHPRVDLQHRAREQEGARIRRP